MTNPETPADSVPGETARLQGRYDTDPAALAWARGRIQHQLDRLAKFEEQATATGKGDVAAGLSLARRSTAQLLLGGEGCVVGAFDERRPQMFATWPAADPAPAEPAHRMAPERLLEAAATIRAHAAPAAAEIRQAYFSDYPRVARAQLAEPLGAYAALMHPVLGEALAVLLEVEARVDSEDQAALRDEGRVPEEEHRSCTVASCTTLAALAVADAIRAGAEQ